MRQTNLQRLNEAIALAQTGRKDEAHHILADLASANPDDANLLLWLAFTSHDLAKAGFLLERVSQLDPANPSLPGARNWLAEEEPKQPLALAAPAPTYQIVVPMLPQPQPAYATTPSFRPGPAYYPANPPKAQYAQLPDQSANPTVRRLKPLLLAGIVVGGLVAMGVVVVLAIVLLNVLGGDRIVARGLPVYAGASRLEVSEADRSKLYASSNLASQTQRVKNFEFEVYAIKKNDTEKALQYYYQEMTRQGWRTPLQVTQQQAASTAGGVYQKENRYVMVMTAPPGSGNTFPSISNSKIQPGDVLIVVFAAEETR